MRPRILFVLAIIGIAVSCREETDPRHPCAIENPAQDLAWLANQIAEWENSDWGKYAVVTRAKYGYETVFIFGNCCPFCNTILPVYNCSGEQVGIIHDNIDESILDNDILVWKSENSLCNI